MFLGLELQLPSLHPYLHSSISNDFILLKSLISADIFLTFATSCYKDTDIRKIRKKLNISQAILAYLLNAKLGTVQKCESGVKHPCGANNRLLQIIEKNGLEVLQTN